MSAGKQLNREFLEREFRKPAQSRLRLISIEKISELHETYSQIVKAGKGYPPSSKELRSDYYDSIHAFRHHFRDAEDHVKVVKYFADFSNFKDVKPLKVLKGKIEELSSPDFYEGITQAGRMRRSACAELEEKILEEIKAALVWNVFQHYKFPKKL